MLTDDFRVNHRAACESLLQAAASGVNRAMVYAQLEQAAYFETEAMKHLDSPRQRALGTGMLYAIDLMRVVADVEFQRD